MKYVTIFVVGAMAVGFSVLPAKAATEFASTVVSYTAGTGATTFTNPSAALGAPAPITGLQSGFPNVLSPFSPAYDTDQIVVVGEGGELTLKFASPVKTSGGPSIGVISNVGLVDVNYPDGQTGTPITSFGGGSADVSVSANGTAWVSLGVESFTNPANYFLNAGPYDTAAPTSPELADFGQVFSGTENSFANETYPQILSTLDGSGGGTWLDLSATGLSQISFIEFSVPDAGTGVAGINGTRMVVDSVAAANGDVVGNSVAVPLPSGLWMSALGLVCAVGVVAARHRKPAL